MPRTVRPSSRRIPRSRVTENLAGGAAFTESPKLEFVSTLFTSFVQSQHYRKPADTVDRTVELLDKVPNEFAAKAALYARDRFQMRSISHVVAAELAHRVRGEQWFRRYIAKTVVRPDDILEILGYYMDKYGKKGVPSRLKRGISDAFEKFDEHKLAKYRGENRALSLVDAVRITHPKPTPKNAEALEKLIYDELKSAGTWEVELTKAGQEAESEGEKIELKAGVWTDLVESGKIGHMALVRNLRNILQTAPNLTDKVCVLLVERDRVKNGRMLPFRYITAANELKAARGSTEELTKMIRALNRAAELSLSNIPQLDGRTVVAVDVSGSMKTTRVGASETAISVASLFAAMLVKNGADIVVFADRATQLSPNPDDSLLTIQEQIASDHSSIVGQGTRFSSWLNALQRPYDNLIVISDMQSWMDEMIGTGGRRADDVPTKQCLAEYKSRTGAKAALFSFDLAGYGTLQLPEKDVFALAGFSPAVFDIMALLKTDKDAMISQIERIRL